jgi:endogenous inhibitor of DNA gyrase (YacG/DUF329 family)
MKIVKCPNCGCTVEYNDKSIWEGNRELEDVECPYCKELLDRVFIDGSPTPRIVKRDSV